MYTFVPESSTCMSRNGDAFSSLPTSVSDTSQLSQLLKTISQRHALSKSQIDLLISATQLPNVLDLINKMISYLHRPLKIPVLSSPGTCELSTDDIGSIISHCFFGSFMHTHPSLRELTSNFHMILPLSWLSGDDVLLCKLEGWLSYFTSIRPRIVSFERTQCCSLPTIPSQFNPITITLIPTGSMFDDTTSDAAMVDFANKHIGGGTLRGGMVQEEIMFVEFADLLPSMLINSSLKDNEAVIARDVVRNCKVKGYDRSARLEKVICTNDKCDVIIVDATNYRRGFSHQYSENFINRDLMKLCAGFDTGRTTLITGHWGCGVFHGDKERAFVLQVIVGNLFYYRNINYYAFGDLEFVKKASVVSQLIERQLITPNFLYRAMLMFRKVWKSRLQLSLLEFLFFIWLLDLDLSKD
ncbi:hypothetical protein P9112_010800 [Eukaryota sp. TZLM1-RC]